MPFELQAVVWTTLILFVLLVFQGGLVPVYQGFGWGFGNRDAKREFTALQNRTARTLANHIEGMVMFVPMIVVVQLAGLSSDLTIWGAGLYLAGRLAFTPLYVIGVPYLRSLSWGVSLIGLMLIGFEVVAAAI